MTEVWLVGDGVARGASRFMRSLTIRLVTNLPLPEDPTSGS